MLELKKAFKHVVSPRHGGKYSVEEVAARIGIEAVTLYQYGEHRDLPARLVPIITLATNDTGLIEWMCKACGGEFLPGKEADAKHVENILVPEVMQAEADLHGTLGQSLEDGVIDETENERINRRCDRVSQKIANLRAATDAAVKPKPNEPKTLAAAEQRANGK